MPTVDDLPRGFQIRGRRTTILLRVVGQSSETDADTGRPLQVITAENGGDAVEFVSGWPGLLQQFRVGDVLRVEVERLGDGQARREGDFSQPEQQQRNPYREQARRHE